MHIEEIIQKITPANKNCAVMAQARFDALIKPVGSLAKLEEMTARYAGIKEFYQKDKMVYPKREILVWCTIDEIEQAQKILQGKYPVNVLAAKTGAKAIPLVVTAIKEAEAMEEGATLVQEIIHENGLEAVGFGCLAPKDNALVLAAMCGGILQAASMKAVIMLDGVATCTAAFKATVLAPTVLDYCFAGHLSAEEGAEKALEAMGLKAPLRLNIPDGSGEGAALCFTLLDAGIRAFKEMETFEEAGVHVEMKEFSLAEQKKKEQVK